MIKMSIKRLYNEYVMNYERTFLELSRLLIATKIFQLILQYNILIVIMY